MHPTVDKRVLSLLLTLAAALVLCLPSGAADQNAPGVSKKNHYLYIWAGDQGRTDPDFLAVVNFNESSRDYGKVIRVVPLPPPGNTGNETHHMHLSADKRTLACGGLLSLLKGQNEIFFFDTSVPENPRFLSSTNPPNSSITDEFYPLEQGGFLVTMMGSASGGAPGRVAEYDGNLQLVAEWPASPPEDGFNPHGLSVRPELNLMVTSDFLNPATTLNFVDGDVVLRASIRVWDFQNRTILRTIPVPGGLGTMDVKLIPGDPEGRAYSCGTFDGHVHLIDTAAGTSQPVFDIRTITPGGQFASPQLIQMTSQGDRLIFGLFETGQVVMLDVSDRVHPKLLSMVNLGLGAGPHHVHLMDDDKTLVVSDYFLDEDDFGKVHYEGDHKIHVIKVKRNKLELDRHFSLDFNTAFPTGPARPHGMAIY